MGRKKGISKGEIANIYTLNQKDFDYTEWLILKYAREWTLVKGKNPSGDIVSEYETVVSSELRRYIDKLLRMMIFANYFGNKFLRRKKGHDACSLN
ncbi:hypothetical protein HRM2_34560 [Desulforapulum autotrophicum HRM2]|uniref:Uncharacterized protein n=1 Tax=Desulforapulum autotrophicum (strain ATCC 43914 / DSM 3382 / VKM B-1955 / HRM2) TaxID=177437 RepID=C0Q926_DESAH|nr:hypothetical protein [Desulforapulum autotrophicum]ACN16531.1 hypothetical protein HRM2_34560 [Desulforapulum autotrophicum HRM2]